MGKKVTNIDFIRRCKEKHGDEYDYSITQYVSMAAPILYVCPKHGIIEQNAHDHVRGHGCPKCSKERQHFVKLSSREEFIEKAKSVHGNKYDYSKVEYYNNNTPVTILCPVHGEFMQTPHAHKSGNGCPLCKKIDKNQFLLRAREKFGWKYDYSKAEYVDFHTKICIIHPVHGEFWQTPESHLKSKSGYIGKEKKNVKQTRFEKFVNEFSSSVYGREYDYSKTKLTTKGSKITIICPEHGEFQQRAETHMKGGICPKCRNIMNRSTKENFIKKAKKVHGDKYDYSQVDCVDSQTKVAIICHEKDAIGNEHGIFFQKPNSHLQGHGCPQCSGHKKTTEQWIGEAKRMFPLGKYTFEKTKYTHARDKVVVTCAEHGDFLTLPRDFLRGHGCPKCQMPKLETSVEEKLLEQNIVFERQKKFPWLSGMSFDFYIKSENIAIECQGEQHYVDKDFFNKREGLKERVERDSRKRQLCKENGIELIYFLEPKFEKYETSGNLYFTDIDKLIEYINSKR